MRYHVVFKENEQDFYSKGHTYNQSDYDFELTPEEVLKLYRVHYPNTEFMALYVMQN